MNKTKEKRKFTVKSLKGYIFLLPWLIGFFGLTAFPMLASLYFSLCDYDMLTAPVFIGIKNYINLLADPKFKISLVVTLKFVFISVPLQLAFALLIIYADVKLWKALINAITILKNTMGVNNGNVILKNCLIFPAPSILDAS